MDDQGPQRHIVRRVIGQDQRNLFAHRLAEPAVLNERQGSIDDDGMLQVRFNARPEITSFTLKAG